ncbi:MAG: hypothetical protein AAGC63_06250 [Propionicimonas sp.]|nr:hypothetical protein [Propionicimonas sp.]
MILNLLVIVIVVLFLLLTFGPLESLGWWRDKGADEAHETLADMAAEYGTPAADPPPEQFVIYLSGIGAIDGSSVPPEEVPLVDELRRRLPTWSVANDVFPYSVSNRGLTAQRPLAGLWKRIETLRIANPTSFLPFLVNARNAIQLFVCADRRYGPTYNIGTAQEILKSLLRHGYQLGSGVPVTLIGWSGGAQIALGASWYLGLADLPLKVISLGGMMSDDYGLDKIQLLTHLRGTEDVFEKMGRRIFAGRWPGAIGSPWSRARAEGRIVEIDLGPIHHNDKEHYYDPDTFAPDGRSYLQVSTDAIHSVLIGQPVKEIDWSAEPKEEAGPAPA